MLITVTVCLKLILNVLRSTLGIVAIRLIFKHVVAARKADTDSCGDKVDIDSRSHKVDIDSCCQKVDTHCLIVSCKHYVDIDSCCHQIYIDTCCVEFNFNYGVKPVYFFNTLANFSHLKKIKIL